MEYFKKEKQELSGSYQWKPASINSTFLGRWEITFYATPNKSLRELKVILW